MTYLRNLIRESLPTVQTLQLWKKSHPDAITTGLSDDDHDGPYMWAKALTATADKYLAYDAGILPAGRYVYATTVVCTEPNLNVLRIIADKSKEIGNIRYTKGKALYTVPFVLSTASQITLRAQVPNETNNAANYR